VHNDEWRTNKTFEPHFNHQFIQVVYKVARSLGVELARVETKSELTPAHRDIELYTGLIARAQWRWSRSSMREFQWILNRLGSR
jgi:hypothetical protein